MSTDTDRAWAEQAAAVGRQLTRTGTKYAGRLADSPAALVGFSIVVPVTILSVLAPVIAPFDPTANHVPDAFSGPSTTYLLGTDQYGRDLLSRVLYGGRTSLLIGVGSTLIGLGVGVPFGIVAGYSGGRVDEAMMRASDIVMSFPAMLLALLLLVTLSSSVWNVILAIGIVFVPRVARVVRAGTLSVKNNGYVLAAQARGESSTYIMFRTILPNILPEIVVEGSIRVGFAILIGTSLSFLGLGAQPPTPDWGLMIADARSYLWRSPWLILSPSVALGVTVVGFNLLGDGLRDLLNPQNVSEK
jgi:peptide/nickel transport system permease protein